MANFTKKTINCTKENQLPIVHEKAAGIDIGAHSIFVCAGKPDGKIEIREYSTFTQDLRAMAFWLKQCGITDIAMESTGVYWIPVYDILESEGFKVTLVNAFYLKTVPGRKTDVKDCQWIQKLHSFGLLQGSFRPDNECLILRTYVRQRSKLFELGAMQVNLMHKALTQMNIQLHQVLSDITGTTGMDIIRAIIAGETNPTILAQFRKRQCKKDEPEIAKALEGNFRAELIFGLTQALEAYDFFHQQIVKCELEIKNILEGWERYDQAQEKSKRVQKKTPFRKGAYCFDIASNLKDILGIDLRAIPGLDANTIIKILSEIGTDMSRWLTSKHFISWLGLCPGNKISGGKVISSKTKPSSNKAAQALRMAAQSLHHSQSALGAFYRRMRGRLGAPKAITATAHKLAKIIYTMLQERVEFQEIGQAEYELRYKARSIALLKRKAAEAGFDLIEKNTSVA
jgi:transposase